MKLYSGSLEQFRTDVKTNKIADLLAQSYFLHLGREAGRSEYMSWHYSLRFVQDSFDIVHLEDGHIVVEHELPYSNKRIDVLLFAKDGNQVDNCVVLELKQWTDVRQSDIEGNVITALAGGMREVAHPSLQVRGYHWELTDNYTSFDEQPEFKVNAAVFCHNYETEENVHADPLLGDLYQEILTEYPVFTKYDVVELGNYLKQRLEKGKGAEVFRRFDYSKIRPSKRLLTEFTGMIQGSHFFNLIDDQIAAYNAIIQGIKKLSKSKEKTVIIIKGGPGTGKSVLALETMVELMQRGKTVFYATGSSAFTKTLRKIAGKRAEYFFKYFFNFTKHENDAVDVIICDEAHRLRPHSNDYGVPFQFKSKEAQVDDLIRPAKLSIFFIDEHQVVRPREVGSIDLIKESAMRLGSKIYEYELTTQFRCSGSSKYMQWLENLLDIQESDEQILSNREEMVFEIVDSPLKLKQIIEEKNKRKPNSARLVAGFCWPWSDPRDDGSLPDDVVIGDFAMPWEAKHGKKHSREVPDAALWAYDPRGEGQVGTVYTAQGFEFDYIGVIFADDLVYDPSLGRWVGRPENSNDKELKRDKEQFTELVKNVYRVLLSRAHHGVYVYFVDKTTEEFVRSKVEGKL